MMYRITHSTRYTYDGSVPIGYNRVYLRPRDCPYQTCVRSQLEVTPVPAVFGERNTDYYGNDLTFFTVQEQHSVLDVTARSEVDVTPLLSPDHNGTAPWESVARVVRQATEADTLDALQFTYPSESVAVSEALRDYALPSFPTGRPILAGAVDLMTRIYEEFTYDPHATTISTPVEVVLENKRGVCQDFAHFQIGCLRALGLPARYVSGYVAPRRAESGAAYAGAQASHAWLSVYTPGSGWVDLDPTNNVLPGAEHITVAWGRNYDEVSPMRGVILGGGNQRLEVSVDISRMPE